MNERSNFRVSAIRGVLRLCAAGESINNLREYVSLRKVQFAPVMRIIRAGKFRDLSWTYTEKKGTVEIKLDPKSWALLMEGRSKGRSS